VTQIVTANGVLNPVQLVEVGSQISGSITEIKVDYNSRVKKGEVIAQIDPATYERAKGQAEAELVSAQAAEEMAQLNYDRGKELFGSRLISKSDFDQLRVNLSQAKAQSKTRQAFLDSAQVDLSRTTIRAPIDGVVITRKVEAGQTVAAAMTTPTLFTIANDLHKMQIEAAVSEADIGGVEEGQKVQFTVDAFPGRLFEGSVKQVRYAPSTNQNVVTYGSVVDVDNKDLKLRPGMTASTRFITAERKDVLKIPLAAIRFRPSPGVSSTGETNAPTPKAVSAPGPIESGARMQQRDGRGGDGVPGGGFAGDPSPKPRLVATEPKIGTVYLKERPTPGAPGNQVILRAVSVKLGIADASSVEIVEGVREGEQVVSGTFTPQLATGLANPLGRLGGPPRPR
jgi:HlyD family secretion protein